MTDVTSPDGSIGVNAVIEERSNVISGSRLYIDIYKNNTLILTLRPAVKQNNTGNATEDWIDTFNTFDSKTVENGANYNDLVIKVTDPDNNKDMTVRIRVFNNCVMVKIENIYGSQYYNSFIDVVKGNGGISTTETVIAPSNVNELFEDTLTRDSLGNIPKNTDFPPFIVFPSQKVLITQATLTVVPQVMRLETRADNNIGCTFQTMKHPVLVSSSEADWLAIVFYDKLNDVYSILTDAVSTAVTVKTYNRTQERWLCTWDWYNTDIDDTKVRNLADIAVEMGLDGLIIDDGWQSGTSATQVDTNKFPNWQDTINYIKSKGLKVGIHVYFKGVISDGIDTCINTWKNWGIDLIKIGYWTAYINDTGDPYDATQKLRQLLDALYNNGFTAERHECGIWCTPYEYQNVLADESYPEGAQGSYWNFIRHFMMKTIVNHNIDLNGTIKEATDRPVTLSVDSGAIFATMFATSFSEVTMDEWNSLDDSTKNALKKIFSLKEYVNEIYYYDDRIEGYGDNVVFAVALSDTTVSLDVPFDAYKIKDKTISEVSAGTYNESLTAGQGVVFCSRGVVTTGVYVTNEEAYHGNYSCKFVVVANYNEGEKYVGIKQSQDLTGFNKVKFALKITELTGHCVFEVWAGNIKLAEYTNTTSDWEEKEVDVSSISGTQEVKFIARAKDYAEDRKIVAYLDKVVKAV